jgi:hypothetical protein
MQHPTDKDTVDARRLGMRLIEICLYTLKPGTRILFHSLVRDHSVPLQQQAGLDVVAFGQSESEANGYHLVRSFDHLEHLERSLEDFYASTAWRSGPREGIVSLIESDASTTMWLSKKAVEAMRLP